MTDPSRGSRLSMIDKSTFRLLRESEELVEKFHESKS
jgi:hypothetical protein